MSENQATNTANQQPLEIILEGLLFSFGSESTVSRLAKIAERDKAEVQTALQSLKTYYESQNRGLGLMMEGEKVQMVTSAAVSDVVSRYQKSELEGPLSKAALETLSIISYKGPITKPEIDTIRGVNSGLMLRTLLIRGLIDRKKAENDARTFSYSVSLDFLRHLGVTSQAEIPGYKEFAENKVLEKLAASAREVEATIAKSDEAKQVEPAQDTVISSEPEVAVEKPEDEATE